MTAFVGRPLAQVLHKYPGYETIEFDNNGLPGSAAHQVIVAAIYIYGAYLPPLGQERVGCHEPPL